MACNSNGCERGFYCDSGTHRCETCHSICDPSRFTEYACRIQTECREFWHESEAVIGNEGRQDEVVTGNYVTNWQLILAFVLTCLVAVIASLLVRHIWTRRRELSRESIRGCLECQTSRTPIRQEQGDGQETEYSQCPSMLPETASPMSV